MTFVVSLLHRTPGDLSLLYDILAGPNSHMIHGWRLVSPPPRTRQPSDMRIAVCTAHASIPTEHSIRDAVKSAGESLKKNGVRVDFEAMPEIDVDEALEVQRRSAPHH